MPLLLGVAFALVPIVEITVLISVGRSIGVGPTLVLLLVVSILGAALVKREGAKAWRSFQGALAAGRPPAKEVADGAMLLIGGTLLLTPGFVTDVVGTLLVLPPTRALLRRRVTSFVARRLVTRTLGRPTSGMSAGWAGPEHRRPPTQTGRVVEGEVVDGGGPERR